MKAIYLKEVKIAEIHRQALPYYPERCVIKTLGGYFEQFVYHNYETAILAFKNALPETVKNELSVVTE